MSALPGLFIDGFAGGGGASTGIAQAIGREVDIAINHSPTAIAIHKANHPSTEHHCTDIRMPFLPRQSTRGRPVAGAWFSPDCKEFSKAKGGPVKDRNIRALCWEVIHWIEETDPECSYLENVEEFEYAAPLDGNGVPIAALKGKDFQKFVGKIRRTGRLVDWKKLRACDYGTPTSRLRLYMVMKKKRPGAKIVWPKPTHGPANDEKVLSGELLPYRTAAECIDWSISCPSIFERTKELAEATKRRIAHGVMRYVVNAAIPFIVCQDGIFVPHVMTNRNAQKPFNGADEPTHTVTAGGAHLNVVQASLVTYGQQGGLNRSVDKPLHAVTASKKDTNGLACATMVKMGNGEREGQDPRALDVNKPYGTVTAKGSQAAAVTAFLSRYYGSDKTGAGGDIDGQIPTIRAGGTHHAVVAAHMAQFNTNPNGSVNVGHDLRKPVSTIATKGPYQGVVETTLIEEDSLPPEMMERAVRVAAFLVKYYGTDGENETSQVQGVDRPMDVITTKARYAVVTVTIDAVTYVIVDIGLRMLKPRELARAQGFPDSYVLDPIVRKFIRGKWVERRLTIAEQISAIGNSVCPPVARALVAANQPELIEMRMAA